MEDRQLKVLATGFEPFSSFRVNSSWEAVKELKSLGIKCRGKDVSLEIQEMEVSYEHVTSNIPKLWDEIKPDFCLHVGLTSAKVISLEKRGRNKGYCIPDNRFKVPAGSICQKDGKDMLECPLDVEKIHRDVLAKTSEVEIDVSTNAGQYLCDFIYYSSLYLNRAPVLFVHVPPLDKPYTKSQLAEVLKHIVEIVLFDITTKKN